MYKGSMKKVFKAILSLCLVGVLVVLPNLVYAEEIAIANGEDPGVLNSTDTYRFTGDDDTGILRIDDGDDLLGITDGASISVDNASAGLVCFYNDTGNTTVPGTIGAAGHVVENSTIDCINKTIYFQGDVYMPINFWNTATAVLSSGVNVTGNVENGKAANLSNLVMSGTNVITGNVGTTNNFDLSSVTVNGSGCSITGNVLTNSVDLNGNTLAVGGTYEQTPGTSGTLAIDVASGSSYGNIAVTGDATIDTNTTVDVNVTGYVQSGKTLTIVDGNDGGTNGVAANIPVTDNSLLLTFSSNSATGDNLALTVSADYAGFASGGNNEKVANALKEIDSSGASGDMATVLGQLQKLSTSTDIDNAYGEMDPTVDSGLWNASYDIGMGAIQTVMSRIAGGVVGAGTGVSTGEPEERSSIWAKGFGNYTHQDKRKGIDGYEYWTMGTGIGYDYLIMDTLTLGFGAGYAYSKVDSKQQNINDTRINCLQTTMYGAYETVDPVFVDNDSVYANVVSLFGWNWYNGSRSISVGSISRTADADYEGQQYQVYSEIGYDYPYAGFIATPLASLGWTRLHIDSYTENGAGDLNLKVESQDYDKLEQGVGIKVAYPFVSKDIHIKPEVHFKWLYDYIGDIVETSSTFTGGGPAFDTRGYKPDSSMYNFGSTLFLSYFNTKVEFSYDFAFKDKYYSHNGVVTVKYSF